MSRNLDVYNLKTIQTMLSILGQYKNDGITNIETVLSELQSRVQAEAPVSKVRHKKKIPVVVCPSCGKGRLFPVKNTEGLPILGCKRCRYSVVVNRISEQGVVN